MQESADADPFAAEPMDVQLREALGMDREFAMRRAAELSEAEERLPRSPVPQSTDEIHSPRTPLPKPTAEVRAPRSPVPSSEDDSLPPRSPLPPSASRRKVSKQNIPKVESEYPQGYEVQDDDVQDDEWIRGEQVVARKKNVAAGPSSAEPKASKSRFGVVAIATVLVLSAVGIALRVGGGWEYLQHGKRRTQQHRESAEAKTSASIEQADLLLRQDQITTYADAAHIYEETLKHNADLTLYLRLARTHARWAQALRFHVTDSQGGNAEKPNPSTMTPEARRIEAECIKLALKAESYAKKALGYVKSGFAPKVELALADTARLLSRQDEAKVRLRRAQALLQTPDGDDWYIATLVDAEGAHGNFCTYEEQLRRASQDSKSAVGVSLLLARCYQHSGRKGLARAEIEGVRARFPGHSESVALLRAWTENGESVEPAEDEFDQAPIPEGEASTSSPEKESAPQAPLKVVDVSQLPNIKTSDDLLAEYGRNVKNGFALLYHRRTFGKAREYFNKAIEMWPRGGNAYAGLGYAARAERQMEAAANHFSTSAALGYKLAWFELGKTYLQMTRYVEARKAYQRYMTIDPQGRLVKFARRALEDIATLKDGDPLPRKLLSKNKNKTDAKVPEAKPGEMKPGEIKPTDILKPGDAKPADAKTAEGAKPGDAKLVPTKPSDIKAPTVTTPPKTADTKVAPVKPTDIKAADAKAAEKKPVETKPVEAKPPAEQPAETKPAVPKASETKPVEKKP